MSDKLIVSKEAIAQRTLLLMLVLMACGGLGAGFQPVRILIIILLPICIVNTILNVTFHTKYRYEIIFGLIWLIWAMFSLTKAVDMTQSILYVAYMAVGMIGFLELLWLSEKIESPEKVILKGWIIMILCTIPIALYEIILDSHLSLSVQESGSVQKIGEVYQERRFASVTFGNLNAYNTIICMTLPFVMHYILIARKNKEKILGFCTFILLAAIIFINSSRGALLCLAIDSVLFILYYFKNGGNRKLLLLFLGIIVLVFIKYLFNSFTLIIGRFSNQGFEDVGRVENIVRGIDALIDSNYMGIGAGNYKDIMGGIYNVLIPAPHNLFLEVLVLFGIFIFLGFLGLFIHIWKISGKKHYYTILYYTSLLFICFIDSNYLLKVPTWLFMASMFIVTQGESTSIESEKTEIK